MTGFLKCALTWYLKPKIKNVSMHVWNLTMVDHFSFLLQIYQLSSISCIRYKSYDSIYQSLLLWPHALIHLNVPGLLQFNLFIYHNICDRCYIYFLFPSNLLWKSSNSVLSNSMLSNSWFVGRTLDLNVCINRWCKRHQAGLILGNINTNAVSTVHETLNNVWFSTHNIVYDTWEILVVALSLLAQPTDSRLTFCVARNVK